MPETAVLSSILRSGLWVLSFWAGNRTDARILGPPGVNRAYPIPPGRPIPSVKPEDRQVGGQVFIDIPAHWDIIRIVIKGYGRAATARPD